MATIICYTRKTEDYSPHIACSLHLGIKNADGYEALYNNVGICYAKATINPENNSQNAMGLIKPYMLELIGGGYAILAQRNTHEDKSDDSSKGKLLLFVTNDFIHYDELGLVDLKTDKVIDSFKCDVADGKYVISWKSAEGEYFANETCDITKLDSLSEPVTCEAFYLDTVNSGIVGAIEGNELEIPENIANKLVSKLRLIHNVAVEVPESVCVSSAEELAGVKVTAVYSDGSTALKSVDWDASGIDFSKAGTYTVKGEVKQKTYKYPVAENKADPDIEIWNGKYYFIATHEVDQGKGLILREADCIDGLFAEGVEEYMILEHNEEKKYLSCFWAPEFHIVGDDLYIFFAVSGDGWNPQCHVMKLKKGGDPTNIADWEEPIRVQNMDGSNLSDDAITLDMTCFEVNGQYYLAWARRWFKPADSGSIIYIATVDTETPWKLSSEPVMISRPLYGWENDNDTPVDEGPFAIKHGNRVYLTFAGSSTLDDYTEGVMYADMDADLLDADSWTKTNYPLLLTEFVDGEYGPGHSSFFKDTDGTTWYVYHARDNSLKNGWSHRDSGIRINHFDIDGELVLYMTPERELAPENKQVKMTVTVK